MTTQSLGADPGQHGLTPEKIARMSYNELIGLVRETNRPPGGIKTLTAVARSCFLGQGRSLLEIGTATGFSALTLAALTGADITAVDINPQSLQEAEARARVMKLDRCIRFVKEDATSLSFSDGIFDVVFCGNVTSLVSNREKALAEYARVLKPGGILATVPMYYVNEPAPELVEQVRAAIQVQVEPHDRTYWIRFFQSDAFMPLETDDFVFDAISPQDVDRYCDAILGRPHLYDLPQKAKDELDKIYRRYLQLFRVNLSHMGYTIATFQKVTPEEDRELFHAHRA